MKSHNKAFMSSRNRLPKAAKIEAVLCDYLDSETVQGRRILDCGCGSGHIARYFAERNVVFAADIEDNREMEQKSGVSFALIESGRLPFQDDSFDIVVLNHVLVYVADQKGLLDEVNRVLRRNGICYLALPNRNFPLEAHLKIPFIHYLPWPLFFAIFRRLTRSAQPVYQLSHGYMLRLFRSARFKAREYTVEILRNPLKYSIAALPFHRHIPHFVRYLSPTSVFILSKE